jgi:hypothetical protein
MSAVDAGDDNVEHLERMRSEGASYIVFPKRLLTWLMGNRELQSRLEDRYRGLMRDGNVCAIYDLR